MTVRSKTQQNTGVSRKFYYKAKRILDIFGALTGLFIFALPLLVLALIIYIDDAGSVFFFQDRVGRNGKVFRLCKLRTMKPDAPAYLSTEELENPGQYVTKVGRILRKLSLDEIPQLFNVLKGDMSLIGPRPLIPQEKEIHEKRTEAGVYTLRPGITGLAQINGRDHVKAEEKVVTFKINTDKKTVGDALSEHKLISGEKSAYGLYVKFVNGIEADYNKTKSFWAFSKNGESMMTGVDGEEITDGSHYEFVYTKQK